MDSGEALAENFITCTYVDANGVMCEGVRIESLRGLDFIGFRSVRNIPTYRGQRSLPGLYWFAALNRHVAYESRLEMIALMLLDFEGDCVDVLPQPLAFHYSAQGKKTRWHVPDFLVSLPDGQFRLLDVKPLKFADESRNQKVFGLTRVWSQRLGWDYGVISEPSEVYLRNLKWLAGFKRRPVLADRFEEAFIEAVASGPTSIAELLAVVHEPVLARPVLFHMLWRQFLAVDMDKPLEDSSRVVLSSRRWSSLAP